MAVRRVRRNQEPRGWAVGFVVGILKPALLATTKQNWIDGEKIPASGGCMVVLNHISHVDPLTAAHILWDHGRIPRYLAKSGLFKNKVARSDLQVGGPDPGRAAERERRSARTTPRWPRSAPASASWSTRRGRSPATRRRGR